MFRASEFTKEYYKTGEVARILDVHPKTVQAYDNHGILPFSRTTGNRRVLERETLLNYLDKNHMLYRDDGDERFDVLYARVSSHDQKQHGDLDRQMDYLLATAPDVRNPRCIKEVGSGMNDNRKGIQQLLKLVLSDKVRYVYITYKDRLTRFGFRYFQTICDAHQTEIVVLKSQDDQEKKSCEQELVEDMMSMIASFSGRLYGSRSGKNKRKKELEQ